MRAGAVLETLSSHYSAHSGCLFGVTGEGVRAIARLGDVPIDDALRARVDAYLSAELASTEVATAAAHDEHAAAGLEPLWAIDQDGSFLPVLLRARRDREPLISGVALVRIDNALPLPPEPDLLDALGQSLLLDDRIDGMRADG
jgi:hypothetical protein